MTNDQAPDERPEEYREMQGYTNHRLAEFRQAEMLADAKRERLLSARPFEVEVAAVTRDDPHGAERIARLRAAVGGLLTAFHVTRPQPAGAH